MAGGKDMMGDLVNKLAELQAERKVEEAAVNADDAVTTYRAAVAAAEKQLEAAKIALASELEFYEVEIERINTEIEEIEAQIVDTWDGEKRTVRYDAGLLKFRTTTSLKIKDDTLVLTGLLDHTSMEDVATRYIKGFNLTAVKKYMGVLELPMGAAELVSKTTVKLEVE